MLIQKLCWLNLCAQYLNARILAEEVDYLEAARYARHITAFSRGLAKLGLLHDKLVLPRCTLNLEFDDASQAAGQGSAQIAHESASDAHRAHETADDEDLPFIPFEGTHGSLKTRRF